MTEPSKALQTDIEEAALWALRLEDQASDADWAEFEVWVSQDPKRMSLVMAAEDTTELLTAHSTSGDVMTLRRDAMQRARKHAAQTLRLGGYNLDRRSVAAAAVAMIIGPAALYLWSRPSVTESLYTTGIGEQKTLKLADGSSVILDANSQIKVALSKNLRLITLVAGRAFFDVAKDKDRPFRVKSGERAVTALGTAFSVENELKALVVTLIEGRVAVSDPNLSGPIEMSPNQQLRLAEAARPQLRQATDFRSQLKWREGQLYFDDVDIGSAVARMNNYSHTPIVIGDASIATLRISGMFRADDPEGFADALRSYFQLDVTHTNAKIVLRAGPQAKQFKAHKQ